MMSPKEKIPVSIFLLVVYQNNKPTNNRLSVFHWLLIHSVSQIHSFVQDSDYLNIAAVEYSIEQEVFACLEASQSVEYLVVAFAEKLGISRYLLAGGYQHIVIVIRLLFRPLIERVVPDVGKVFDRFIGQTIFSHLLVPLSKF